MTQMTFLPGQRNVVAFSGATGLLLLAWVGAAISAQHYFPISTFYQELAVAAAVLLAAVLQLAVPAKGPGVVVPWIALPFGGLALLGLLDIALQRTAYADAMIWPLGSLAVAAIAALLAARWAGQGLSERLMQVFARAFVLGAVGTALSMWAQVFLPDMVAIWLFPRSPLQAPMGNIAQRNQAALFLGFGLLALAYGLRADKRRRSMLVLSVPLVVLLTSGIVLSQSRIGMAFLAVAGVMGGMMISAPRRRVISALLGLIGAAALYALLQWVIYTGFGLGQLFPPGLQRLADRGLGQRLGLWQIAGEAFKTHPLLGVGLGNYVQWDYRLALSQAQPLFANNAHNLFAQLAAETGLLGLLAVIVPAAISVARAWRAWASRGLQAWEDWRLFALGVCLMVLGYSLTEYPLWYVFFAVPFAMCWAVLDTPAAKLTPSPQWRWPVGALLIAALGFCAWSARAYADISKVSSEVFLSNAATANSANLRSAVRDTLNVPSFSPYADALVFAQMGTDDFMLSDKIALGERVVTTYSSPQLIAKLATLYGMAHDTTSAAHSFARLCAYFPNDCGHARENLRALQKKNPNDFDPVSRLFFSMPQSRIKPQDVNVLRPWDHHAEGTVVTIDPSKTWFGFDLALYASGLADQGLREGTFLATPKNSD
ncbi:MULTISPECIES: PglL family O-oligosaccharyltransferase [Thiomonas]|uniref:PglL family O-oligosaccharyltransferase n=1 Tax=Thiomonas TaxID=32012 RepID=UPI001ACC2916|nr:MULTISPECIES: O-antigen ligase family protein [Thiomonas]MBN8776693.1 O-antigen ligase C-terminal domain-containing protein [Thiomonas arsenitoxydans]HML80639.1 Wzy polymerase domain-containing protein [Thiomonas arsenitoxydans]